MSGMILFKKQLFDLEVKRQGHKGPNDGFYISRRDMWGRKLCILATQKENSSHLFRISRSVLEKFYSRCPHILNTIPHSK
jgi:hypothetical protein